MSSHLHTKAVCRFVYNKKQLKTQWSCFKLLSGMICVIFEFLLLLQTLLKSFLFLFERVTQNKVFYKDCFVIRALLNKFYHYFSDFLSDCTHHVNLLGDGCILIRTNHASAGKGHSACQCVTWHPPVSSAYHKFSLFYGTDKS